MVIRDYRLINARSGSDLEWSLIYKGKVPKNGPKSYLEGYFRG